MSFPPFILSFDSALTQLCNQWLKPATHRPRHTVDARQTAPRRTNRKRRCAAWHGRCVLSLTRVISSYICTRYLARCVRNIYIHRHIHPHIDTLYMRAQSVYSGGPEACSGSLKNNTVNIARIQWITDKYACYIFS